jgi:hypothetical protein
MLTEHKKMIIRLCIFFGILLCILGCIGAKMMTKTPENSFERLPRRSVKITIETSQRQEFFDQLRKYADKHDFTILIDTRSSGNEDFLIAMYRKDIEISGDNAFYLGEYDLFFYDIYRQPPAPDSVLDDLVNDLQSFISVIPGVLFSVEGN